jgi:hypothetical protein
LNALEASPAFSHVELVNEKEATTGNNGLDRLEVELKVDYSRT